MGCEIGKRSRAFWIQRGWPLRAVLVAAVTLIFHGLFLGVGFAYLCISGLIGGARLFQANTTVENGISQASLFIFLLSCAVFAFGFFSFLLAGSGRWRSYPTPIAIAPYITLAIVLIYAWCLSYAQPSISSFPW